MTDRLPTAKDAALDADHLVCVARHQPADRRRRCRVYVHRRAGGPCGSRHGGTSGSLYTRALNPEDSRALRRDFVSGLSAHGRDGASIVSDMQSALTALRTTPFDPDAFAQAMADQSDRRAATRTNWGA